MVFDYPWSNEADKVLENLFIVLDLLDYSNEQIENNESLKQFLGILKDSSGESYS